MAYSTKLADRVRAYLDTKDVKVSEKEMFRGLAFLVNGKMCVNISGENLMCRFDPHREEELSEKVGFMPMFMKGKQLHGYCYVGEEGYKSKGNFEFWIKTCLDFNADAKASSKKRKMNAPTKKKQPNIKSKN